MISPTELERQRVFGLVADMPRSEPPRDVLAARFVRECAGQWDAKVLEKKRPNLAIRPPLKAHATSQET